MADDNEEIEMGDEDEGSIISESEVETQGSVPQVEPEPTPAPPPPPEPEPEPEPQLEPAPEPEPPAGDELEEADGEPETALSSKSLTKVASQPGDTLVTEDEEAAAEEGGEGEAVPTEEEQAAEEEAAAEEEEEEEEEEVEKEPPRYIEPLGEANEETLAQLDYKSWILEKEYREGKMGRLGIAEVKEKKVDGGSMLYEDYLYKHRQLEKLDRKVPSYMALGDIRLKPDELKYEEEKFVLGKMFRDVQDNKGYIPTAEGRESEISLCCAVEVTQTLPKEPMPCFQLPSNDETSGGVEQSTCVEDADTRAACIAKITSPTGKVYEFSFSGMTTLSLQPESTPSTVDTCGGGSAAPPAPAEDGQDPCSGEGAAAEAGEEVPCTEEGEAEGCKKSLSLTTLKGTTTTVGMSGAASSRGSAPGTCRMNSNCESEIEAVCKAARNAMAIYDTLTGSDNFPCNLGDREDTDAGVWSWLYHLIYKMVPIERDTNGNQNQATVDAINAVSKMFEPRPDDL